MASEPTALSAEERARTRQLAGDLPALWNAETTGNNEHQAIVRLLVERVIVTVVEDSEQVAVEVRSCSAGCAKACCRLAGSSGAVTANG